MKIIIILPFKEIYNKDRAGAVSILVNSHLKYSRYKKSTVIFGSEINDPMDRNIFCPIKKAKLFTNRSYIKSVESLMENNFNIVVEIHNRPEYFVYLKKKFPDIKFILFLHNDPTNLKGSETPDQRNFIAQNCDKVIFLSKWIKNQFLKNTNINANPSLIVFYPGIKTIDKFPLKKKIVLFVGKLNSDKGYDLYLNAIDIFLKKFPEWRSISVGAEYRRKIQANKNTKELGQISNDKVLKLYENASIAVANSVRDEPLGRLPIEASSRGCISIVSKSGGLMETIDHNSIILKKNTPKEIAKNLVMLASNIKNLEKRHLDIIKNFKYDLKTQTLFLDNIRSSFAKKINNKCLKIIHITNFNERFDGRLHFNSGKKISSGLIKLGHNVLNISDRDILQQSKSIFDLDGSKSLNAKIIQNHKNFEADLIILGHTDAINIDTINALKKINNVKICQWFLDPIIPGGPDYYKNFQRINKFANVIDATFLTTSPDCISPKLHNAYFIPNPTDESFETLEVYNNKPSKDLFFAMSHGVHRGVLKKYKFDEREIFLNSLIKKSKNIVFDFYGLKNKQPVWGSKFLEKLSDCSMALNLSRGPSKKYYSSDRIAQLMGNGVLTFIDKKTKLNEIINSNEAVFYKDVNDLIKKIYFYKNNSSKRIEIAKNGKKASLERFNSKVVAEYIIAKTFRQKIIKKFNWQNIS
ncbi:MAG: glycosyltransferase [Proteobacteria bacterium]|nr:glycosyltransferase [Pseudomonadota bacterium]